MSYQEILDVRLEPVVNPESAVVLYASAAMVEEVVELDEPYQINVPPIEPSKQRRSGYFAEAPTYYQ